MGSETPAGRELLDEALAFALENFTSSEAAGLLYMRFEAHRCLAVVRVMRGELNEAETLCAAASDIVSRTESRVSQLWLGPLYLYILLAVARKLKLENKPDQAATKINLAKELLGPYQQLVAECQSPNFVREAERLERELSQNRQQ